MTNFLLAFNRKRDHAGAEVIAELLAIEPRPPSVLEGLAEVYIADLYNEVGEYEFALDFARQAEGADDPLIQRRSWGEAMIALAGLGRREEALINMERLGLLDENGLTERSKSSEGALHARALLAASAGNASEAVTLMNQRLDLMIGKMYARSSADTSSFLSHLENNRDRQVEREAALQREAELKAIQLEQKNRLNRLLWILIAGLTIAFNLLLAFLRYREKNNAKLRVLQEEALSAERMKTEFLGNINHELRTPLNGIIGISDAMIHHADDPVLRGQAEVVQESGQLLHDLLDSLITMSTLEGDKLELDKARADVAALIEAEAKEWTAKADAKGLAMTCHIAPDVAQPVIGDGPRLRRCVRYLLSNAVRFTHAGRVHLHATAAPDGQGRLALTIVVADTGQGISEDVQSRMFKPFLQADSAMTRLYGGAGLSLAIGRKLARMMGGDLVLNSREGRGSEFTLTVLLPLADGQQTAPRKPLPVFEMEAAAPKPVAKTDAAASAAPAIDHLDEPEEIIDLMLRHPLLGMKDEKADEPPRKAAG